MPPRKRKAVEAQASSTVADEAERCPWDWHYAESLSSNYWRVLIAFSKELVASQRVNCAGGCVRVRNTAKTCEPVPLVSKKEQAIYTLVPPPSPGPCSLRTVWETTWSIEFLNTVKRKDRRRVRRWLRRCDKFGFVVRQDSNPECDAAAFTKFMSAVDAARASHEL